MPIEIKEVIIKTSVEKEPPSTQLDELSKENIEVLKKDILKNCEEMISKVFKQQIGR